MSVSDLNLVWGRGGTGTETFFGGVSSERGFGVGADAGVSSSKSSRVTELPYRADATPNVPRLNASTRLPSHDLFVS